jgi:hypothetical protein
MDLAYADKVPKGQVLDFDYDAYYKAADAIAGHTAPVGSAFIELKPKLNDNAKGRYFPGTDSMVIEAPIKRSGDFTKANRVVLHETRHLIDDRENYVDNPAAVRVHKVSESLGKWYMSTTEIATSLGLLDHGTYDLFAHTKAGVAELAAITLPAAAFFAGQVSYSLFDPSERRARKAERIKTDPVIRLVGASALEQEIAPANIAHWPTQELPQYPVAAGRTA